jgi:hypothetical protein
LGCVPDLQAEAALAPTTDQLAKKASRHASPKEANMAKAISAQTDHREILQN